MEPSASVVQLTLPQGSGQVWNLTLPLVKMMVLLGVLYTFNAHLNMVSCQEHNALLCFRIKVAQ